MQQPCVALTVYVAMCHKFRVCIEWRRSDYCRELSGKGEGRGAAAPHGPLRAFCGSHPSPLLEWEKGSQI